MMRFAAALVALLFLAKVLGGTPLAGTVAAAVNAADRYGFVLAALVLAAAVALLGGVLRPIGRVSSRIRLGTQAAGDGVEISTRTAVAR